MSKWVNVTVIAVKELMIEIEDSQTEDDAMRLACDEIPDGDEFGALDVESESIDAYKRHADLVISLKG